MNTPEETQKWYRKTIWIVAMLILFFPVGLFLMWKYARWSVWIKGAITGLFVLIIIGGSLSDAKPKNQSPLNQNQPAPTTKTLTKNIDYEVVKTWEIPNGGFGKVIVISAQNFNEADMTTLGEKLRKDFNNDRNSFVFIFDDKKAAIMRDKVLTNELTTQDQDYYDRHYVGEYTKNGNSGYHQLTIFLDGVMGSNQRTIKY